MSKHFRMYIRITDVVGEKRIDLAYPIQGKEVAVVSMLSGNVQYQIRKPLKVLLLIYEEKMLREGTFTDRELNLSIGRKVIMTLDADENIIKTHKLAGFTVVVVDELNSTDNLEDGRLSNVLLRHHVTDSEEFMHLVAITPQYKRLVNGEFASLTLRIMN